MSRPQLVPSSAADAITRGKLTTFSCHAKAARAIFLAGSFNDWSATRTPLSKSKAGEWAVSLPLPPGHYEYKFVVDGEWSCEPGCTGGTVHCQNCVVNEFGTMNRVLEVHSTSSH